MISNRLKEMRKIKGFTAQYMADELQIGVRNYRKYESGHVLPTYEGIVKLTEILGVTSDYLLGIEDVNRKDI